MLDALNNGRRFRVLAIVDDFTRECVALSLPCGSGANSTGLLNFGRPAMTVSDNSTELTSQAILPWQEERSMLWHYIAPGKP